MYTIQPQEVVVVIGPSGSGKSTFFAVSICWKPLQMDMFILKELDITDKKYRY